MGNFKLERVYTIMSRLVRNNNIQFVTLTKDLAKREINFICSVFSESESMVETKEELCFYFYDSFIDSSNSTVQF